MKGHGDKISRKQELAIAALLTAPTIDQAAKIAGIGSVTLRRWMQNPEFDDHYRAARREAVSQAIAQLQKASSEAVKVLRDVMGDNEAPHGNRVTAAKTVLEMSLKAIELEDLEVRVAELEAMAETQQERGLA